MHEAAEAREADWTDEQLLEALVHDLLVDQEPLRVAPSGVKKSSSFPQWSAVGNLVDPTLEALPNCSSIVPCATINHIAYFPR